MVFLFLWPDSYWLAVITCDGLAVVPGDYFSGGRSWCPNLNDVRIRVANKRTVNIGRLPGLKRDLPVPWNRRKTACRLVDGIKERYPGQGRGDANQVWRRPCVNGQVRIGDNRLISRAKCRYLFICHVPGQVIKHASRGTRVWRRACRVAGANTYCQRDACDVKDPGHDLGCAQAGNQ